MNDGKTTPFNLLKSQNWGVPSIHLIVYQPNRMPDINTANNECQKFQIFSQTAASSIDMDVF